MVLRALLKKRCATSLVYRFYKTGLEESFQIFFNCLGIIGVHAIPGLVAGADGSVKFDAMGSNVFRYTPQIFVGERKDISVLLK